MLYLARPAVMTGVFQTEINSKQQLNNLFLKGVLSAQQEWPGYQSQMVHVNCHFDWYHLLCYSYKHDVVVALAMFKYFNGIGHRG